MQGERATRATTGTNPSCQRCCAASASHSGKTKGARPCKDTPYLSCPATPHLPRPYGGVLPGSYFVTFFVICNAVRNDQRTLSQYNDDQIKVLRMIKGTPVPH